MFHLSVETKETKIDYKNCYLHFSFLIILGIISLILCLIYKVYIKADSLLIEIKTISGTNEEKEMAEEIKSVLKKRNWLYITITFLMLFSIVFLTLIINKFFSSIKLTIIVSVLLIFVINGILPELLLPRQNNLLLYANKLLYLTKGFMIFSSPLTYPVSLFFDCLIGDKYNIKHRILNFDIKALIEIHKRTKDEINNNNNNNDYTLSLNKSSSFEQSLINQEKDNNNIGNEEANLLISALEIKDKCVSDLSIPIEKTFMLDYDEKLSPHKLKQIIDKGYSRIPVYANHNKNNILGLVRIKQLIGIINYQGRSLREIGVKHKPPLVIHPNESLFTLLREFRKGKSHMAFITEQVESLQRKFGLSRNNSCNENFLYLNGDNNYDVKVLGIVTLEDVIENIFKVEIYDEDDYENMKQKGKKRKKKEFCGELFRGNKGIVKEELILLKGIEDSLYRKVENEKESYY